MIKASAGNIEFAELYVASNLNNLLDKLKKSVLVRRISGGGFDE